MHEGRKDGLHCQLLNMHGMKSGLLGDVIISIGRHGSAKGRVAASQLQGSILNLGLLTVNCFVSLGFLQIPKLAGRLIYSVTLHLGVNDCVKMCGCGVL